MAAASGFCGRCGAPYTAASGPFCGRCGNAIPTPAAAAGAGAAAPPPPPAYGYPLVAAAAIPGATHRLGRNRLLIIGAGALAVVVVIVTAIAVIAKPTTHVCGFFCGPRTGTRLASPSTYQNQQWGYTVEYDKKAFNIANQDANGAAFVAQEAPPFCATQTDGEIDFTAVSGSDVGGAIQKAFNGLNTSVFQGIRSIGSIGGAEIGQMPGQGFAYSASFTPPNGGGQAVMATIAIIGASFNGVTLVATAWSEQATDVSVLPFKLCNAQLLDNPLSNVIWKGSQ
jgi:hypothetical protein